MTTYSAFAVSDTVIAFEKGITLQQGRALRDNPIAISEGSSGAPYAQAAWHPYDGVTVGDGNTGLIYDSGVSGAVASVTTPDFDDGYEYMVRFEVASGVASNDLEMIVYRATSGSYSGVTTIISGGTAPLAYEGFVELIQPRIVSRRHWANVFASVSTTDGAGVTGQAMVMYSATAQKLLKAQFAWSAGNIDAGVMYLYRRRTFIE